MATSVYKVYKSGSNLTYASIANAPSGGFYVADGTTGSTSQVARVASDGSLTWAKELSLAAADSGTLKVVVRSNGSDVAVIAEFLISGVQESAVVLYNSSGTLIWEKRLPAVRAWVAAANAVVGSDGAVYLALQNTAANATYLAKLNGTAGAVDWIVNVKETSYTHDQLLTSGIAQLSGGDLVMYVRGPIHNGGSARGYIQRVSSSTGAIVWTRAVAWGASTVSITTVGVDNSDNVYAMGRSYVVSGDHELPVLKLDADGATIWARNLRTTAGLDAEDFEFYWDYGGLTADASGVHLATTFDFSPSRVGHVFVPAAGTIATSSAPLTVYPNQRGVDLGYGVYAAGGGGSASLMVFPDQLSGAVGFYFATVIRSGASSGEDGAYGLYTRTTYNYDVIAGTATVSTPSYTRTSAPSLTATSSSFSSASGTLLSTLIATGGTTTSCYVSDAGPLGQPQALSYTKRDAYAADSGPLGQPVAFARQDFTSFVSGLLTRYVMDLVTPDGIVRVPIGSWQATLQTEGQSYLQCVVPACASWVDDINAATEFVISRSVVLADGRTLESEMARGAPVSASLAQGGYSYSATITGYSASFAVDTTPAYARTLAALRTAFNYSGKRRIRCGIDWLLRPGQTAIADGDEFTARYISYYVNDGDTYMDVAE